MTTITIDSPIQLQSILSSLGAEVVNEVSEKLLKIFREEYIQKYVYDNHGENKEYDPTGQFKQAWEFTDVKPGLKEIVTELFYNWSTMTFSQSGYVHSSASPNWPEDVREGLADWLNRHISSSHWFSVYRPELYWDMFIKEMVDENRIEKLFTESFAKRGIRT